MWTRILASCFVAFVLVASAIHGIGDRHVAAGPAPTESLAATTSEETARTTVLGQNVHLVDLTHPFDEHTIFWPTEIPFRLERGFAGFTEGGWYYAANRFAMAEHSGTHIDAPLHFAKDAAPVDQIPVDRLVGPAAVVDVSRQCRDNPDFLVPVDAFQDWEKRHNQSLSGLIVLVRTGWSSYWPDRKRYLGTDETGKQAVAKLHFPGLAPEAAAWLVRERKIKAVGIDTASIDRGQSTNFGAHVALCTHGTPAFENVAHLDQLPPVGSTIIALPMKIRGGSGGPLRIVAAVPDENAK